MDSLCLGCNEIITMYTPYYMGVYYIMKECCLYINNNRISVGVELDVWHASQSRSERTYCDLR